MLGGQDGRYGGLPLGEVHVAVAENGGDDIAVEIGERGRAVFCPNRSGSEILRFEVDGALVMGEDKPALRTGTLDAIASEAALKSKASSIVLFGEDTHGKAAALLGPRGPRSTVRPAGLIQGAAAALFSHLETDDSVPGTWSVRLSWFQLRGDVIVDVLREVAGAGDGSSSLGIRADPHLGTVIPDLWEVDVPSAGDVARLVDAVRPTREPASDGAHECVQLTVKRARVRTDGDVEVSPPLVGQLTLLSLGDASHPDTGPNAAKDGVQPWVRALQSVLRSLERGDPSTPFSSNRTTALLRQALTAHAATAMIACVPPHAHETEAAIATLKFATRLRRLLRAARNLSRDRDVTDGNSIFGGTTSTISDSESVLRRLAPRALDNPASLESLAASEHKDDDITDDFHPEKIPPSSSSSTSKQQSSSYSQPPHDHTQPQLPQTVPPSSSTSTSKQDSPTDSSNPPPPPPPSSSSMAGLEQNLEQVRNEVRQLRARLQTSEAERTSLAHALSKTQEDLRDALERAEVAEAKPEANAKGIKARIGKLERALGAARTEVEEYHRYREAMTSAAERMKRDVRQVAEERDRLARDLTKAQTALRKERTSNRSLKDENAALREKLGLSSETARSREADYRARVHQVERAAAEDVTAARLEAAIFQEEAEQMNSFRQPSSTGIARPATAADTLLRNPTFSRAQRDATTNSESLDKSLVRAARASSARIAQPSLETSSSSFRYGPSAPIEPHDVALSSASSSAKKPKRGVHAIADGLRAEMQGPTSRKTQRHQSRRQ